MSTALRINDELVHEAETEARIHRRTTPKQIEYWAQIGKIVANSTSGSDLLALMNGLAEVQVKPGPSVIADPNQILDAVKRKRADGSLRRTVSQASVRYEASRSRPGLLDRIQSDGRRETGHFRNGEFIPSN